jgi:hypothetical protein
MEEEIKDIFKKNQIDDLKRFLSQRQSLNKTNMYLIYAFHITQSAGILTTTLAAGYDKKYLIWIGCGINMLASIITIFEKLNNNILDKLMVDIQAIKDGSYIDEEVLVDPDSQK